MSTITSRFISIGLLFIIILLSGFWLARAGKPYSTLVLTVHKLIGFGVGVFLVVRAIQTHQGAPLGSMGLAALVLTALFFLGMIATGGLISADVQVPSFVATIHKYFPYLTVLGSAATIFLLG